MWRKENIDVTTGRALISSRELVVVEELNSSPSLEPREDQWSLGLAKERKWTLQISVLAECFKYLPFEMRVH